MVGYSAEGPHAVRAEDQRMITRGPGYPPDIRHEVGLKSSPTTCLEHDGLGHHPIKMRREDEEFSSWHLPL